MFLIELLVLNCRTESQFDKQKIVLFSMSKASDTSTGKYAPIKALLFRSAHSLESHSRNE